MKKSLILFVTCLAIMVAGCTSNEKERQSFESINLVASEKTLPSELENIAVVQDPKKPVVARVTNQQDYEVMWHQFTLEGDIPEVNLKKNDFVFIGMFESSSCTYEIDTMKVEAETKELTVDFSPIAEACTADLSPRNFVIAI
ncbi:hypothetical protein [Sporosarcina gallistercoris]|uniref:Lipoprotein n=1 Tax=Sporosarcina gallistercoris TaxID=2762245 RepID=A0ABR8PJG8_9BACL|nr:hypothetical protein [Sporosarcina gallistercoris]MBD7908290.1 hypothetical protein [Sporosarcina gallistercoris]